MAKAWLCVLGMLGTLLPLRADWKIVTVGSGLCAGQSVQTEYFKGQLRRSEVVGGGTSQLTMVEDGGTRRLILWDAKQKEYSISAPQPAAGRPVPQLEQGLGPAPIVHIDSHTTDTGERETLFGRTARHLITTEKRSREDPPGSEVKLESETVTDGWYVEVDGLPAQKRAGGSYSVLISNSTRQAPSVKATHMGVKVSGLAVRQTLTWRPVGGRERQYATETKQLQEGELSSSLFEPPADFRHVDQLSNTSFVCKPTLSDEIEAYWNSIESWLLHLFS